MLEQRIDVLMRYCIARDARNYQVLFEILEVAVTNPGLEAAISSLRMRFGSNKAWTPQLLLYRKQFQENGER